MNQQQQAILARDTIDFIRQHANDVDVLEYLESALFSIARIIGDKAVIDWDSLASICDQRYYSIKIGDPKELDYSHLNSIYNKSLRIISRDDLAQP